MSKKIIIHPCENQAEMLRIALDYTSENPGLKCKGNGSANLITITKPNENHRFVGSVMETKVSIIFKGRDNDD